jgi:regulator of sigma D
MEEPLKDQLPKTTYEACVEFRDAVMKLVAVIDSEFKISDKLIWLVKGLTRLINAWNEFFSGIRR